jgi:hypothetical protein
VETVNTPVVGGGGGELDRFPQRTAAGDPEKVDVHSLHWVTSGVGDLSGDDGAGD